MYRWIMPCLLSSHLFAAIPIDGLYTTAFGGLAVIPGNIDKYISQYNINLNQASYNSGFSAGGSLGYKTAFFRYEAEVTYLDATVKQININQVKTTEVNGDNQGVFAFANVFLDLPYKPANLLQPFIGGGIGYGWLQNNYSFINTPYSEQINNNTFAYQGTAGLGFHFSENYSLSIGYRYLATPHINTLASNFQAHLLNASVIYRFDSCEYK